MKKNASHTLFIGSLEVLRNKPQKIGRKLWASSWGQKKSEKFFLQNIKISKKKLSEQNVSEI